MSRSMCRSCLSRQADRVFLRAITSRLITRGGAAVSAAIEVRVIAHGLGEFARLGERAELVADVVVAGLHQPALVGKHDDLGAVA